MTPDAHTIALDLARRILAVLRIQRDQYDRDLLSRIPQNPGPIGPTTKNPNKNAT